MNKKAKWNVFFVMKEKIIALHVSLFFSWFRSSIYPSATFSDPNDFPPFHLVFSFFPF